MYRRVSIFVLLIFLINLIGFFGYFLVRLHEIHEESREALKLLPDSALEHFILTPEEYRAAVVNEREVLIHDKMYDVARVVVNKNQVNVFALHDEAEDDLLAFIREVMANAEKDGPAPLAFAQFTILQFHLPFFCWQPALTEITIIHQTGYLFCQLNPDYLRVSPPPRSV